MIYDGCIYNTAWHLNDHITDIINSSDSPNFKELYPVSIDIPATSSTEKKCTAFVTIVDPSKVYEFAEIIHGSLFRDHKINSTWANKPSEHRSCAGKKYAWSWLAGSVCDGLAAIRKCVINTLLHRFFCSHVQVDYLSHEL